MADSKFVEKGRKGGSYVAREATTGKFVVQTFRSQSAEAGAKLAAGKGTSAASKNDYGRLLNQDVRDYGGYILEKRLGRPINSKG